MANQKYRLNNGDCRHCGSPENAYHMTHCPIVMVMEQHHNIAHDVVFETMSQLDKWDIQNHPIGSHKTYKREADNARQNCEDAFMLGEGTWRHILEEEYWEAWAEEDPEKFEAEMVQVAAVAVSAIAASKRARGA